MAPKALEGMWNANIIPYCEMASPKTIKVLGDSEPWGKALYMLWIVLNIFLIGIDPRGKYLKE